MTTFITIADTTIHQDTEGRYSLNDLHKAAGKEEKHQPAFFMRRNETIELIDVISNSAETQNWKPTVSKSGRYGGTYVCKELVYSYAMWISAAFALKVIRAYDALVSTTHPEPKALGHYNFPAETADPHHREFANASLTPRAILDERNRAPELELLDALEQDGYDVAGARLRIHAMYYIARDLLYIQQELADAGRHMQQVGCIIRNGTTERGMDVCFGRGGQLPTTFKKRELPKPPKAIRRQLVCGS